MERESVMRVIALRSNRKGFTIVEVLVALAVLAISMMALLYAAGLTFENTLLNEMRNNAIKIAEQRMETLRNTAFTSLADGNSSVSRNVRKRTINYSVSWTVQNISANSRAIQVLVTWSYRKINRSHSITSVVSRDT